jgi:HSP20 family molecular chaperone IbpA
MDLHENSESNTVTATFELPGLKKEDVHIDSQNGQLTISGESKISSDHDENGYAVRERRFGKFSRTLRLPQGVKVRRFFILNSYQCVNVGFSRTRISKRRWIMVSLL